MNHPVDTLAHDHRELNGLLLAVHDAISRVFRGESKLADELHEIRDGVEAFREELLEHFAREQEALLPFVVQQVPSMRERCDALVVEHDRIAEQLTDLVRDLATAEASGELISWSPTLDRVEASYSFHTKSELAFFDEVEQILAERPSAVDLLRELIDEG